MINISTKEKILEEAIRIFNLNGTTKVSTVSLAKELDMSVGNLYYHYENKEHIIRTIYTERIVRDMDSIFYTNANRLSENGILSFFLSLAKYTYRYRFFYFDIYSIIVNDPELAKIYSERSANLISEIIVMFNSWIQIGIMKQMNPVEKQYLAENSWMFGQTWTLYGRAIHHDLDASQLVSEEIMHLYQLLKPHFTDISIERFEKMIELTDCFAVEKSKALLG